MTIENEPGLSVRQKREIGGKHVTSKAQPNTSSRKKQETWQFGFRVDRERKIGTRFWDRNPLEHTRKGRFVHPRRGSVREWRGRASAKQIRKSKCWRWRGVSAKDETNASVRKELNQKMASRGEHPWAQFFWSRFKLKTCR